MSLMGLNEFFAPPSVGTKGMSAILGLVIVSIILYGTKGGCGVLTKVSGVAVGEIGACSVAFTVIEGISLVGLSLFALSAIEAFVLVVVVVVAVVATNLKNNFATNTREANGTFTMHHIAAVVILLSLL